MKRTNRVCVLRAFWTNTITMHGSSRLLAITLRATGGATLAELVDFLGLERDVVNRWLAQGLEDGAVAADGPRWRCALPETCFVRRQPDGPLYTREVHDLAVLLADRIRANGAKAPDVPGEAWLRDVRLLVEVDGHAPDTIARVIRWATTDAFWRCNILSPRALRKSFDRLVLRMAAEGGAPAPARPEELERARRAQEANPYLEQDAAGSAELAAEIGYRPLRRAAG